MGQFARTFGWTVFAVGLVVVSVLSLLPHGALPAGGSDKLGHFSAYAALGCVGMLAAQGRRTGWLILVGLTTWGGLLELGQLMADGRTADWLDALTNAIGAGAGILVGMALSSAVPRFSNDRGAAS